MKSVIVALTILTSASANAESCSLAAPHLISAMATVIEVQQKIIQLETQALDTLRPAIVSGKKKDMQSALAVLTYMAPEETSLSNQRIQAMNVFRAATDAYANCSNE